MNAISLWEPWASLVRTGAKTWETRSWETKYRGPLLICAAKKPLNLERSRLLCSEMFQRGLSPLGGWALDLKSHRWWYGITRAQLSFGMAVAIVDLTDCVPTSGMSYDDIGTDQPFGDFSPGRFAWKLEKLIPVDPFPVRGRQKLFEVSGLDIYRKGFRARVLERWKPEYLKT